MNTQFTGRSVRVLVVTPELVLDLLRNLEQHDMTVPEAHQQNELVAAKVIKCSQNEGKIWLYLEKPGWPPVERGHWPFEVVFPIQSQDRCAFADEWHPSAETSL